MLFKKLRNLRPERGRKQKKKRKTPDRTTAESLTKKRWVREKSLSYCDPGKGRGEKTWGMPFQSGVMKKGRRDSLKSLGKKKGGKGSKTYTAEEARSRNAKGGRDRLNWRGPGEGTKTGGQSVSKEDDSTPTRGERYEVDPRQGGNPGVRRKKFSVHQKLGRRKGRVCRQRKKTRGIPWNCPGYRI